MVNFCEANSSIVEHYIPIGGVSLPVINLNDSNYNFVAKSWIRLREYRLQALQDQRIMTLKAAAEVYMGTLSCCS